MERKLFKKNKVLKISRKKAELEKSIFLIATALFHKEGKASGYDVVWLYYDLQDLGKSISVYGTAYKKEKTATTGPKETSLIFPVAYLGLKRYLLSDAQERLDSRFIVFANTLARKREDKERENLEKLDVVSVLAKEDTEVVTGWNGR